MTESMTITEALAEVSLSKKKITNAEEQVLRYLARPDDRKDPHEEDGGSKKYILSLIQSIEDTLKRLVRVRKAIARANAENYVTVGSITLDEEYKKTIESWLIWRREVYPYQRSLYNKMVRRIDQERKGDRTSTDLFAQRRGLKSVEQVEYPGRGDIKVEYEEKHLANLIEGLDEVNGKLDGRLTLFNSTVEIQF